jgi:hypothetical protein
MRRPAVDAPVGPTALRQPLADVVRRGVFKV